MPTRLYRPNSHLQTYSPSQPLHCLPPRLSSPRQHALPRSPSIVHHDRQPATIHAPAPSQSCPARVGSRIHTPSPCQSTPHSDALRESISHIDGTVLSCLAVPSCMSHPSNKSFFVYQLVGGIHTRAPIL